jgi:hypothetical protein
MNFFQKTIAKQFISFRYFICIFNANSLNSLVIKVARMICDGNIENENRTMTHPTSHEDK